MTLRIEGFCNRWSKGEDKRCFSRKFNSSKKAGSVWNAASTSKNGGGVGGKGIQDDKAVLS